MDAWNDLERVSRALVEVLGEAKDLVDAGILGEPLRAVLHFATDLLSIMDDEVGADLGSDPALIAALEQMRSEVAGLRSRLNLH